MYGAVSLPHALRRRTSGASETAPYIMYGAVSLSAADASDTHPVCGSLKSLNHDAWNRIQEKMNIPVPDLKKKKESLFASYRKYKKMVKDSCTSGAGENEVYKPVWFAYDALNAFLNDGLTPRAKINTTSNTEGSSTSTTEVNTEEIADVVNEGTPQNSRPRSLLQREVKEAGKNVKEAISLFQESLKKREVPPPDDCEIYAMGMAKKLRSFTEEERLEIMYEFDGIILNRRRAKDPNRFTNSTFIPSSQFSRPSSAMSSNSEPLFRDVVHRQKNVRMAYSEPPQIHIPEEQHTYALYPELPVIQLTQNIDSQPGSGVHIITNEMVDDDRLPDMISKAYKGA